jgi:hypothetical protein
MKADHYAVSKHFLKLSLLFSLLVLGGCTTVAPVRRPAPAVVEESAVTPVLAYYQGLHRMTPAELNRERQVLTAVPTSPYTQLRLAMLLGHPRGQQDLTKGISLLDGILKSSDPAAIALHSLARVVADNYLERLKQDALFDKQGLLLKESQRKALELQEKIDGLADIERTLPQRQRGTRAVTPGAVK